MAFPALNLKAQNGFYGGDASAGEAGFWERPRWLWLRRPATGETLRLVYWADGQLIEDAYRQASWFLRDVRFQSMLAADSPIIKKALDRGTIRPEHLSPWVMMDPILLDILYAYCAWLDYCGISSPVLLTSGFRHLITNWMTEGSARDSEHVKGGAADIVVPGVKAVDLAKFGQWLAGGGVGLYVSRNFIHVDKGRRRFWDGDKALHKK